MASTTLRRNLIIGGALVAGIVAIGGFAAAQATSGSAVVPMTETIVIPDATPSGEPTIDPASPSSSPAPSATPTNIAPTPVAPNGLPTDADHPQGDDSIGRVDSDRGSDDSGRRGGNDDSSDDGGHHGGDDSANHGDGDSGGGHGSDDVNDDH